MARLYYVFLLHCVLLVDYWREAAGVTSLAVVKRDVCRAKIPLGGYCGQMIHRCCGMTVCKMYDSGTGRLDKCPIWATVFQCVCVLHNDMDGRSLATVRDHSGFLPLRMAGLHRTGAQKEKPKPQDPCAGKVPQGEPCTSHDVCCDHMLCSTYSFRPCPHQYHRRCICVPRGAIYGR